MTTIIGSHHPQYTCNAQHSHAICNQTHRLSHHLVDRRNPVRDGSNPNAPLARQWPLRRPCCSSRTWRNVAASAAAIAVIGGGNGDSDPAPDAAGVRQYQRDLFGRLAAFLGPATLIPLGEPLMSLVDTVCIGQFAGTSQLAALGPANLVFSFCQYFLQSLQVATLSLLAGFMRDGRVEAGEELLSTAVAMAAVMGLLTTCVLEAFPEAIISATGLRDPALLPLSAEYVRVRGLAQPAVLVTMVAQSGLLAQQDSVTPALTVAVAVGLSLAGSVLFVAGLGWGLVGAALTTVACQYVGAAALLYGLSVRGKLRLRLGLPRRDVLWQLLRTMGPLSITYICKNVSYLFIQTTAATLQTTKLAAHQALFAVWNLLAWTVSPFEQAALTYLPGSRGWRKRAGISLLVGLGAAGGVACGAVLAVLVGAAPAVLTRDVAVWPHLQSVAGLASASMLALGADVVASGVNIGLGDARYVAQSYLITLSVLAAFMGASRTMGWELTGVWAGVVVFFGVRALQSTGRVVWRHLRPGLAEEGTGRDGEGEVEGGGKGTGTGREWAAGGSGASLASADAEGSGAGAGCASMRNASGELAAAADESETEGGRERRDGAGEPRTGAEGGVVVREGPEGGGGGAANGGANGRTGREEPGAVTLKEEGVVGVVRGDGGGAGS
ncbi:hypothetical protein PLESTB_000478600 [Pleodorina starrii]|uniref:Protein DETOXIFICATION n=1 Tax=Pleodorina starrii TaxID=330485 RepID=A0A9W6BFN6_9CHLO|nr:hypothetical protein PLESTM_001588000 [Pleodorina starrii]GLC51219.1 hypothetical protein PLESTB_000478600 [Pleodorina starrii]GLC63577.1 hypothetical protein PLESTF_000051100 [Pleodorina starrii]